jgi:large subunit ribosomal protein L24
MAVTRSIQPRKQRKARYTAPLHVQGHYLAAPLSRELREQYKRRSIRVVTGDTVKILRGDARGEEGVVDEVNVGRCTLLVHGVSLTKADNTEVPRPVHPSNVRITRLNLKDRKRAERLGEVE